MTQDEIETLPPPEVELDNSADWPAPESKPVAPKTMREIVREWIERRLA